MTPLSAAHRPTENALQMVEKIVLSPGSHSIKSLVRELGVSQSTCYRQIKTLVQAGWIQFTEDGRLKPARGLFSLVVPNFEQADLIEEIRPELQRVCDALESTVKLVFRVGDWGYDMDSVESKTRVGVKIIPMYRFALPFTASGTVLTAKLPTYERESLLLRHRERSGDWFDRKAYDQAVKGYLETGVCMVRHTSGEPNLSAAAVGIESKTGQPICAMVAMCFESRFETLGTERIGRELKAAAARLKSRF